jgi:hypothetical protein
LVKSKVTGEGVPGPKRKIRPSEKAIKKDNFILKAH